MVSEGGLYNRSSLEDTTRDGTHQPAPSFFLGARKTGQGVAIHHQILSTDVSGTDDEADFLREMFSQASFPSVGSSQDLLAPSPRMHDEQTATLPDMDAKIGRAIEGAGAPGMIGEEYSTAAGG
ncbi:hypothetical protein THAOC_25213, partial [Thalassiosira oceanica]